MPRGEPEDAVFCTDCGHPLARLCPSCKRSNPPDARFCHRCGQRLDRSAAAAPPAARPPRLHPQAPGREDPALEVRPGGRAQAGDGALRRREGLDGPGRAGRPRGVAPDPGPLLRDPDRRRAPLRGHREPVHGRRDHGALRGADRPRGPRPAGLLRGASSAGRAAALCRRGAHPARAQLRHAHRHPLRRGGGGQDRRRPAHGLHGPGAHGGAGAADGAAGPLGLRLSERADGSSRGGVLRASQPGGGPGPGSLRAGRHLRAGGRGSPAHAAGGGGAAGAGALRGPAGGARAARSVVAGGAGGSRADRGGAGRGGGGQVAALPRVQGEARGRVPGAGGLLGLPRQGPGLSAGDRAACGATSGSLWATTSGVVARR